jgi:hypothetical protein
VQLFVDKQAPLGILLRGACIYCQRSALHGGFARARRSYDDFGPRDIGIRRGGLRSRRIAGWRGANEQRVAESGAT